MERERWQKIKDCFLAAIDVASDEREQFVNATLPEPDAVAEVMHLLSLHHREDRFLHSPLDGGTTRLDGLAGKRIGPFQVIRLIGSGGVGAVYEAQQDYPQRRVAIKLLRPGLCTRTIVQRMHDEATILARLQHPGIAQVYAAGSVETEFGSQPWFAMELIEGLPLDKFARRNKLSIEDGVRILVALCEAVQHAHERGVIHRDLKPSNVMMVGRSATGTTANAKETVQLKVLDFGVARVISNDWQASLATLTGELIGTPGYMSPEQLHADPALIDARSDVYSLGVIGYELLSDEVPHPRGSGSILAYARQVETQEPIPLGQRRADLRGDLEWIVAKALERDVDRRYASVSHLAADLRRFLDHEPVSARKATHLYRGMKFVRRHRVLVGGVFATILALSSGLILYAIEAAKSRRAAQEAIAAAQAAEYEVAKATAINNFMVNDFLMKLLAAGAGQVDGQSAVVDQVDQAAAKIGEMFAKQPLAEAAVRNEVGTIYYNLRAYRQAADQFQRSLDLWQAHLGPDHADTLKAVNNLGQAWMNAGEQVQAEAYYQRALKGRRRILGSTHPQTLNTMNNLAMLLSATGREDEAEEMLRTAWAGLQQSLGDSHKDTLTAEANLATFLARRGKIAEALAMHAQVHEELRRTLGPDHVTVWQAAICYAQTLHKAKRPEQAEPLLTDLLEMISHSFGATHLETIVPRRLLARVLRDLGRRDEALQQLDLALQAARGAPAQSAARAAQIEKEIAAMKGVR